jgi:hypothetical protein
MTTLTAGSNGRASSKRAAVGTSSPNQNATSKAEGKTVNVRANEKMLFFLSQLKSEFGISMSESLRKGIGLFFLVKQEEKKGRRLAFIDEANNVVVEVHSL